MSPIARESVMVPEFCYPDLQHQEHFLSEPHHGKPFPAAHTSDTLLRLFFAQLLHVLYWACNSKE